LALNYQLQEAAARKKWQMNPGKKGFVRRTATEGFRHARDAGAQDAEKIDLAQRQLDDLSPLKQLQWAEQ